MACAQALYVGVGASDSVHANAGLVEAQSNIAQMHHEKAQDIMADASDSPPTSSLADIHPVQMLYARVDAFDQYPSGVVRIWRHINETGFFPGNPGLWNVILGEPLPPWPFNGVMIVGHNYDCVESFRRTLSRQRPPKIEKDWPAFRWLRLLLEGAAIKLEDCFYTNYFIGLKEGARSTDPFPGRHDVTYVDWCRALLLEEIRLQQPTLLLTLGQAVLPFLARLEPLRAWSGAKSLRQLDDQGFALLPSSQFVDGMRPTTVVALTHPSFWPRNVISRRYGSLCGHAAEQALLLDGVKYSDYIATSPDTTV